MGFTRPLSPVPLVHNLHLLHGQSLETIVYLTVSHNLTVYYLFLLGPLLGKDVLLSHLIGGIIFMGVASRLTGLFGVDWTTLRSAPGVDWTTLRSAPGVDWTTLRSAPGVDWTTLRSAPGVDWTTLRSAPGVDWTTLRSAPGVDWTTLRSAPGVEDSLSLSLEKQSFWPLFLDELQRILGLMGYGLLLGGLIAAWGLSPWTVVPAYITTNRWFTQVINALLGGVVSMILWMWPVANLFVGTYLWKIGLAHAGLVTFFYASTISPQRLRLYAQVKGKEQAIRFGTALALAAILAGLGTAILFHLLGLRINYKLVLEQLL